MGVGRNGLIARELSPRNLEYPFSSLDGVVTPSNQFFVRTHFPIPQIDREQWQLKCSGHVRREVVFSYDDLAKLPSQTITATIECAGNSRVFLTPKEEGVQWELGGVGTAAWLGVPLNNVLQQAGIADGATEVILRGAYKGKLDEPPKTPGEIHFSRSLPLEKAVHSDVLLAYKMNGEDLSPDYGYPLRAIVPGWYGMASVKWLENIEVTDRPFHGYWQTAEYSRWDRNSGEPVSVPLTQMQVKSQIARPSRGERIPCESACRVFGAAWAGDAEIIQVEVSDDEGEHWHDADLLGESVPNVWRLWEFEWQSPSSPGRCQLMSRATDSFRRCQPSDHCVDSNAYQIHHVLPLEIEVV